MQLFTGADGVCTWVAPPQHLDTTAVAGALATAPSRPPRLPPSPSAGSPTPRHHALPRVHQRLQLWRQLQVWTRLHLLPGKG